jgi:hypothetical protein
LNWAFPHCSQPRENFNTRRDSDNHSSSCKISSRVDIQTYSLHVMSPYNKSENTNWKHSLNHTQITKCSFFWKSWYNLRNHTETR